MVKKYENLNENQQELERVKEKNGGDWMSDGSNVFEKPSVERLATGGTYVLVFSLLAGLLGWAFMAVASQEGIGVGGDLSGYMISATAFHVIGICISAGFHQGLSKYISEALVESKEKALTYAKAGFFIFNIIGIILFSIFITLAILIFPYQWEYGLFFGIIAVVYYLTFFKDNFVGNLAAVHRFDYIGKLVFLAGIGSVIFAFGLLFLLPEPINAYLLPLSIIINLIIQIFLVFYYTKKVVPYSFSSIFKGARRKEIFQIAKYGLYCTIPSIIFSGAILTIQNYYYIGIFGIEEFFVTAIGLIIGYASIVFSVCQFGWPQIPAVSEAKAMNDYKLIDDYMKNTLHTGFNLSSFFLIIYVGLSHVLLHLFHGPTYLEVQIPFIILSISVVLLGMEFLICTLLMGLGEGKRAVFLIISLTLIQIIFVPIALFILRNNFGPDSPLTLYAGPTILLISSIAIFPLAFHYLKTYTNNPVKEYTDIFWKGIVSICLTFVCYEILELTLFSFDNLVVSLVVRAVILFCLFTIFMLIFAGYNDADLDVYAGALGPLRFIVNGMRWLLHHSPFYESENGENNVITTANEVG